MQFFDFSKILVDENLLNYMEIQNWMRGLEFPESLKEIYDFQKGNPDLSQPPKSQLYLYSDGTINNIGILIIYLSLN